MSLQNCRTFVPNLRALQQNSSHHSIRQDSIHHEIHELSVGHVCADSRVSELVSDFEFSRPERPVSDVLPLCEPLAPLVPVDFPLDLPFFDFSLVLFTLTFALTLEP